MKPAIYLLVLLVMLGTACQQPTKEQEKAPEPKAPVSTVQVKEPRIDLLAVDNGGWINVTNTEEAKLLTDGDLKTPFRTEYIATFSFKLRGKASFDQIEVYVPEKDYPFDIEVFYGDESATGKFTSLGLFTPVNDLANGEPYQKFTFPAVTARYVRIKKRGFGRSYEVRMMGSLE